jgi:hypothetical protein
VTRQVDDSTDVQEVVPTNLTGWMDLVWRLRRSNQCHPLVGPWRMINQWARSTRPFSFKLFPGGSTSSKGTRHLSFDSKKSIRFARVCVRRMRNRFLEGSFFFFHCSLPWLVSGVSNLMAEIPGSFPFRRIYRAYGIRILPEKTVT